MKSIIVINAIIWAVLLLIASYLYKGTENYFYLFGSILVGFTLQNGITYNYLRKKKLEGCK